MVERQNKISIVTINYNNADGLYNTIKSVVLQKKRKASIEFIVVDGASTDHTNQVLEKFESLIDVVISEKDAGIYHAMNKGLSVATGESILFLNSGDRFFLPFDLSQFQDKFELNSHIVFCKTIQRFGEDAYVRPSCRDFKKAKKIFGHQGLFVPKFVYKRVSYRTDFMISADVLWIKEVTELAPIKYCEDICAVFELGGISNNPSLKQIKFYAMQQNKKSLVIKSILKFLIKLFFGSKLMYRIIFWKKFDFINGKIIDSMENPYSCYDRHKSIF